MGAFANIKGLQFYNDGDDDPYVTMKETSQQRGIKIMHADMAQLIDSREVEIAKIAQSAEDTTALQQHVSEIVEDKAFKASPRCEKFLRYVINRALSGNFESLICFRTLANALGSTSSNGY